MQVIITQSNLKCALADIAPVVPTKPALPVIGNVLLRAAGEGIAIIGTNLETGISRHVGARVLRPGAITLPARLFTEVIGGLPEADVTLTLDEATQILRLECGGFAADLHGIEAGEFPTIPSAATGVELTRLPAEELRAALAQVVFAAAENEARPVLNGVLLQIADRITLGATDGFRLAIKHLPLRTAPLAERKRLVASASGLRALITLLKGCKDEVVITTSPGGAQLVFLTPMAELVTRLVEGAYPEIERAVSPAYTTRVTVDADELAKAARLAGFFATHSQNVVKLSATGGGLVISANAAQVGTNRGEVAATLDGQEGQVALNVQYLAEAIGAAGKAGTITLDFQSAQSPGILRRVDDTTWVGAIMPMALR